MTNKEAIWVLKSTSVNLGRRGGKTAYAEALEMAITALQAQEALPSVQPEPCEDAVSRKAVEEMLKNGFPARGMWEIEGDVVKQTVCETLADALMDLEKLPSVQPEIIRCKDCKYWREHKYAKETKRYIPFCGFNAIYTKSDDFCSRAERRTDDDRNG